MAKSPGFVAAAVLTLALGIGANTAIFSIVYGVLLRPLPYRQPDSLVKVTMVDRKQVDQPMPLSDADFFDWKSQNQAFENLAAYTDSRINVTGIGEPEQVRGVVATPAFFATLGVSAELGRTFLPGEDGTNAPAEAVLGHAYWLRRFRGDAGVIGRAIVLNGRTYTIVGVMSPDFQFPEADDPTAPGQVDILARGSLAAPTAARSLLSVGNRAAETRNDPAAGAVGAGSDRWKDCQPESAD